MKKEGMIDKETALLRIKPEQLDELLHPMLDSEAEKSAPLLGKGFLLVLVEHLAEQFLLLTMQNSGIKMVKK